MHKDGLTRFGFNFLEHLISKYSNGKIIVVNKKKEKLIEEELPKDALSIMNVCVAKINGLKSHKNRKK